MKSLRLLKATTTVVAFLFGLLLIIAPIMAIIGIYTVSGDGFMYESKKYTNIGTDLIISSILKYSFFLFLFYVIMLFRKIIDLFTELKFFHTKVITLFHVIGKYLIVISIGLSLVSLIPISYSYTTFHQNGFTNNNYSGFNFSINFFYIGLGLFFMVLSEVFGKAKSMREENDLTI